MTTPLFNVSGIASGLDTNSMVAQLMQVERLPVQRLQVRKATLDVKQAAWSEISTRLGAIRTAAASLRTAADFSGFVTASSSNEDAVTISAGRGSVPQSLSFTVDDLATAHQRTSGTFAATTSLVGAGTFTISRAGVDHAFTTTAGTTLEGLAAQINADTSTGVAVSVVQVQTGDFRLLLTARGTGTTNAFTATGTQPTLAATSVTSQATDARITMGTLTIVRSSNTITDLVPGATITLRAESATPVTVSTARDPAKVVAAVKSLVDELNTALTQLRDFTRYDAESRTAGQLQGDPSARTLVGELTAAITTALEGLTGTLTSAGSVGISVQRDGTFKLDEAKLTKALADDFDGVVRLFSRATVGTDPRSSLVTSTVDTQHGTYAVQITQAASAPAVTGGAWAPPGADTTLTITAAGRTVNATVLAGDTLAAATSRINAALTAAGVTTVVASDEGGALRLASGEYGSGSVITVAGGAAFGVDGTFTGTNVAGTIDGQAATGAGQVLTGTAGGSQGLALRITAMAGEVAAAGGTLDLGTVTFTEGLAGRLTAFLDAALKADGVVERAKDRYENQEKLVDDRIKAYEARLALREATLRRRFTAMENALASLQSQGSFLGSFLGGATG